MQVHLWSLAVDLSWLWMPWGWSVTTRYCPLVPPFPSPPSPLIPSPKGGRALGGLVVGAAESGRCCDLQLLLGSIARALQQTPWSVCPSYLSAWASITLIQPLPPFFLWLPPLPVTPTMHVFWHLFKHLICFFISQIIYPTTWAMLFYIIYFLLLLQSCGMQCAPGLGS